MVKTLILDQSKTIESLSSGKDNNFNLIRFVAAVLVIFSHSYPLTLGQSFADPLKKLIGISYGTLAVNIFFVTSGYLVFKSFVEKPITYYIQSRVLRIFPGLIICNLMTIIFIGIFVSNNSLTDYLLDIKTIKYFINNTLLLRKELEFFLPGTFIHNIFPLSVNGSLWTLPTELMMYMVIPLIGILGLHKKKKYYNFIFIVLFIQILVTEPSTTVYFQFYFLLGIFIYLNKEKIILNKLIVIAVLLTIFLLYFFNFQVFVLLFPFFLAYMVFLHFFLFKRIYFEIQ